MKLINFKRKRLFITFILAATLSVTLDKTLPTFSQTPPPVSLPPSPCDQLRVRIQARAKQDAKKDRFNFLNTDKKKKTITEIEKLYKDRNSQNSCFEQDELWDIYESEYDSRKYPSWMPVLLVLFLGAVIGSTLSNSVQKALDRSLTFIGKWIYNKFAGTRLFKNIALKKYRQALIDKYQKLTISFRPERPLEMREVYVPLKVAGTSDSNPISTEEALQNHRLMIKGEPGSGKSMFLKYLAFSYADSSAKKTLKNSSDAFVPILLELNRLNEENLTVEKLEELLVERFARRDFPKANSFVAQSLNNGNLILLFDGLDEITSSLRSDAIKCLIDFLDKYKKCRAIITCRTAVYNNEFFDVVDRTLEIVEFRDEQIRRFLQAWKSDMGKGKSVEQLIQTLRDRPKIMALARNPLLLTIIAYFYTDTPLILPHSRADFYNKATEQLLELRDSTEKKITNEYAGWQKRLVLQNLALFAQDNNNRQKQDRRSLSLQEVLEQVKKVLPSLNLKPEEANLIIDEIVKRSGILLSIDGGQRYQFGHLTLQEYFVAKNLIGKEDELIQKWQNAPSDWREIVKLWCGLANDSTNLINEVYQTNPLTAFECLADAKNIQPEIAAKIINHFQAGLEIVTDEDREFIEKAFGAVAADNRPRGRDVFEFLEKTLKTGRQKNHRIIAANALSLTNLPEAANILAEDYFRDRTLAQHRLGDLVLSALVRMGDLAVPSLKVLAHDGSIEAFDSLMEIKTPEAAKVLLPFLWNKDINLAQIAAWRLATLLPLPNVEDTLWEYELTGEQKKASSFEWIWEPFNNRYPKNSNLPIIVGMMAEKLIQPPSIRLAPANSMNLDPRIVIPLCAVELESEINLTELKNEKEIPQPLLELADTILNQDKEKFGVRDLIGRVTEKLLSKNESNNNFNLLKTQFIDNILEFGNASQTLRFLLNSLEPNLRLKLLYILYKENPNPSKDDWKNISRQVKYEFDEGWHYRTILIIFMVLSLVALTQMGLTIWQSPPLISWANSPIIAAALAIVLGWIFMFSNANATYFINFDPSNFLLINLLGIIAIPMIVIQEGILDKNIDIEESLLFLPYVAWLPVILYFTNELFLTFYSWKFSIITWSFLSITCILLWRLGDKLHRAAKNPIQKIVKLSENRTLEDVDVFKFN